MIVGAADAHNASVVFISFQQFVAESENIRLRHAVVLENDCAINVSENPGKTRRDAVVTSHVDVRVIAFDPTVPIDNFRDLSGSAAQSLFFGAARAVGDDKKLFGTRFSNAVEDGFRMVRAIEYDEDDGRLKRSGSGHESWVAAFAGAVLVASTTLV
jgi:hypothetical protein